MLFLFLLFIQKSKIEAYVNKYVMCRMCLFLLLARHSWRVTTEEEAAAAAEAEEEGKNCKKFYGIMY